MAFILHKVMHSLSLSPGISESQRCLNNLLLQSGVARAICSGDDVGLLAGVLGLTTTWTDLAVPMEMLAVDLKILFLVTALCPETR